MNIKVGDQVRLKRDIRRADGQMDGPRRHLILYAKAGSVGVVEEVFFNQPPTSAIHHTKKTRIRIGPSINEQEIFFGEYTVHVSEQKVAELIAVWVNR